MSSTESDISNASEYHSDDDCDIVEDELERHEQGAHSHAAASVAEGNATNSEFDSDEGPHEFDPVADEEFLEEYEREAGRRRNEDREMARRFEGLESVQSW